LHEGSIRRAQAAATEAGLTERVEFRAQPIEALEPALRFDLITACDCIHDLPDPVPVLREVRARLAPQGVLFLVELKAGDRLEENLHPIGAMFYGFSLFHCLTQAMARGGTGLGNSLGPARVGALMREAGFGRCELLEIRSSINHFYAVRP
ncbi:MAG TPA: methyltransferase domain-containing protein, partial [bacterium]